jgi:uncharacterized protein (DUF433 family)
MATTVNSHIVFDDRGRPLLEGTTTKVMEVALEKVAWGWDAEEIHKQHPHLPLAKIHAALAYYYDHQAEMDAEIERDLREVEAMRAAAGETPFVKRMRAMGKLK